MTFKIVSTLGLGALLLSGAAMAADRMPPPTGEEAKIVFASHGGIQDWESDGERGIYLQDRHRQWYYARLMGPCIDLPFAQRIGFNTEPNGTFDKFSSIQVRRQRCPVTSVVLSDPPHGKKGRMASR
jgi:hypothetical protein